jgi:hypothetical protein
MTATAGTAARSASRPPAWLLIATGVLALTILALAVAETDLKAHYLIDQGEFISVFGLAFIFVAGIYLYRRQQLAASLPLGFAWLLYPIITQGDQIIDNLAINPMRVICHVLLAAIFATPVAVIVMTLRYVMEKMGRSLGRSAKLRLSAALLTAEIWLAYAFLGTLMIVTLVIMIAGVLAYDAFAGASEADHAARRVRSERFALAVLLFGVAVSGSTYAAYKNAPGAYQGSPSFFMDPSQQASNYHLDRIPVPTGAVTPPSSPEAVAAALTAYARTLDKLLAGYHILDRNYTYDFHNALFLRHQVLLKDYRSAGLDRIAEARAMRADADAKGAAARAMLKDDDPLAALLDDLRAYTAFNFDRAPVLERMSAGFERTQAGLQHAAHLYEGESKYLGTGLSQIVNKHRVVVDAPGLASVTGEFAATSRAIYEAYAHHVVGF